MFKFVSIVICWIGIAACGYHFLGVEDNLPPEIRSIAIPVFENRSSEPRIENDFTNDLIFEFTRSKQLAIAEKKDADVILTGIIMQIGTETIAYTAKVASSEQRVYVRLHLQLRRSDNGEILWSDPLFYEKEEFRVASDKVQTEANKRAAIKLIAERTAEKIHNRIFQNF
jgi:TolB-like protein